MPVIPVFFIPSPREFCSIIEQDKGEEKFNLGGRANQQVDVETSSEVNTAMPPVAMTPPFLNPRPLSVAELRVHEENGYDVPRAKPDDGKRARGYEDFEDVKLLTGGEPSSDETLFEQAVRENPDIVQEAIAARGRFTRQQGIEGSHEKPPPAPKGEAPAQEEKIEYRPFFGQENYKARWDLKKEEPWHRITCYLAAAGHTNVEIAEKTGLTVTTIANTKKQPWAQKMIAEILEKEGRKGVMNVLQGAALNSAKRLIAIAEGNVPGARVSDSVNCAKEILSRCYGSAPQVVLTGKVDANELSDDELVAAMQG